MGVAQFSSTMRSFLTSDRYIQFMKKNAGNIIDTPASKLRASQQVAEKTDFNITSIEVEHMLSSMFEDTVDPSSIKKISTDILGAIADNGIKDFMKKNPKAIIGTTKGMPISSSVVVTNGVPNVTYANIGFDTITNVLNKAFDKASYGNKKLSSMAELEKSYKFSQIEDALLELRIDKSSGVISNKKFEEERTRLSNELTIIENTKAPTIGSFYHKGHLVSVATNLVKQFKELLEKSEAITDIAKKEQKLAIKVLEEYIKELEKADLASANFNNISYDSALSASYSKTSDKYLVQMQPGGDNIDSGSASAPVLAQLRELMSPTLVLPDLLKEASFLQGLIETEGSPSFKSLIAQSIADVVVGTKGTYKKYVGILNIPLPKKKVIQKVVSNKAKIASLKKAVNTLKNTKIENKVSAKLLKLADGVNPTLKQTSKVNLSSLLALINSNLQHVISANMGGGNEKKILNYRTGRFAASAKVESLSESRAGMISAYYSYMRNPYGTFEPGFAQGSPASRNPRNLIGTSIREIAATKVANQLRAVSV